MLEAFHGLPELRPRHHWQASLITYILWNEHQLRVSDQHRPRSILGLSFTMTKPTIVCVPGAWHTLEIYAKTLSILGNHGYATVGLPLPSVGASPPHTSFDEDVKGIRDCLTKLVVDEENEVVPVTHSYTGMPGAEAPGGLAKQEREAAGTRGGVIRLVFIMALAMPEGFQPTAGGAQYPDWMKVNMEVSIRVLPICLRSDGFQERHCDGRS